MSAPKVRLEECDLIAPGVWRPSEASLRHLTRSLRLYEGAAVDGLDEAAGARRDLRLSKVDGQMLLVERGSQEDVADAPHIVLLIGLLKADQFEQVLRVSSELGVGRIVPVICERSIPRISSDDAPKKRARWARILAEATKVSGVVAPPLLSPLARFDDAELSSLPAARYAAMLRPDARPISSIGDMPHDIAVAVGPEGDWSDHEADRLIDLGFAPISLGRRVLRASTAASALLAYLRLAPQAEA